VKPGRVNKDEDLFCRNGQDVLRDGQDLLRGGDEQRSKQNIQRVWRGRRGQRGQRVRRVWCGQRVQRMQRVPRVRRGRRVQRRAVLSYYAVALAVPLLVFVRCAILSKSRSPEGDA
jgi:hypothetical protein